MKYSVDIGFDLVAWSTIDIEANSPDELREKLVELVVNGSSFDVTKTKLEHDFPEHFHISEVTDDQGASPFDDDAIEEINGDGGFE